MALDPEFKAKWVKALRSGRYKQGRNYLRKKESGKILYCCIGVACNLLDSKAWKESKDLFSAGIFNFGDFNGAEYAAPMAEIDLIHGVSSADYSELISLNDRENDDFNSIADWIEANL